MKVNENTSVDMPLKNLISIIGAVAIGVWAYFGIIERLNTLETDNHLIKKDFPAPVLPNTAIAFLFITVVTFLAWVAFFIT